MKPIASVFPIAVLILAVVLSATASAASKTRPHIVVILVDDMGWGDPQCYQPDSKIPTPNLNRFAASGIRFTDAHTPSSVCTPTRYTLLTGRYCWRTSLKKGVLDGFAPPLIQENEDTLASMLKRQGYRTACVGKWHLGMQWYDNEGTPVQRRKLGVRFRPGDNVDFDRDISGGPVDVGFDSYFGISASLDMPPYAYIRDRRVDILPTEFHEEVVGTLFLNGGPGKKTPGFDVHGVLQRFGDEAVRVIQSQAARDEPLFLYLPLNSPHLPVAPSAVSNGKSAAGDYGDFVWETDHVVGRVLDALDDREMTDDTLVFFTSDNGGLWHWWDFRADDDGGKAPMTPRGQYVKDFGHQSNADWRGTKADIYEGGHRVPFIVRWPARFKGGEVCDGLVELTDVFSTVADITGAIATGDSGFDSVSFLAVLERNSESCRAFAVHHSISGMFALRQGNWKLIAGRGSGGFTRPNHARSFQDKIAGQLYDLGRDPREQTNQWTNQPERVKAMMATLDRIQKGSGSEIATAQQ